MLNNKLTKLQDTVFSCFQIHLIISLCPKIEHTRACLGTITYINIDSSLSPSLFLYFNAGQYMQILHILTLYNVNFRKRDFTRTSRKVHKFKSLTISMYLTYIYISIQELAFFPLRDNAVVYHCSNADGATIKYCTRVF